MSIDITIEEMEALPAESYELLISVARLSAPMESCRIRRQAQQMY